MSTVNFVNCPHIPATEDYYNNQDGASLYAWGPKTSEDTKNFCYGLAYSRIRSFTNSIDYHPLWNGRGAKTVSNRIEYLEYTQFPLEMQLELFAQHWFAYLSIQHSKYPPISVYHDQKVHYAKLPPLPYTDPRFLNIRTKEDYKTYKKDILDQQATCEAAAKFLRQCLIQGQGGYHPHLLRLPGSDEPDMEIASKAGWRYALQSKAGPYFPAITGAATIAAVLISARNNHHNHIASMKVEGNYADFEKEIQAAAALRATKAPISPPDSNKASPPKSQDFQVDPPTSPPPLQVVPGIRLPSPDLRKQLPEDYNQELTATPPTTKRSRKGQWARRGRNSFNSSTRPEPTTTPTAPSSPVPTSNPLGVKNSGWPKEVSNILTEEIQVPSDAKIDLIADLLLGVTPCNRDGSLDVDNTDMPSLRSITPDSIRSISPDPINFFAKLKQGAPSPANWRAKILKKQASTTPNALQLDLNPSLIRNPHRLHRRSFPYLCQECKQPMKEDGSHIPPIDGTHKLCTNNICRFCQAYNHIGACTGPAYSPKEEEIYKQLEEGEVIELD